MHTIRSRIRKHALLLTIVAVCLVLGAAIASAQTNTPIPPTATNVALSINTDALFTNTNSWISSFTPVFGLIGGIAIALALLTFVTAKVVAAFRGGTR